MSGTSLPSYLDKGVFSPLHLDMVMDSLARLPGKAVPYTRTSTGFTKDKTLLDWEFIGAGGIHSTPSELVRWADNYRTGDVGGPAILKAQLVGVPVALGDRSAPTSGADTALYVAGMFKSPEGHLFHDGQAGAFRTFFAVNADRRTSVAIACNIGELELNDVAENLLQLWTWVRAQPDSRP